MLAQSWDQRDHSVITVWYRFSTKSCKSCVDFCRICIVFSLVSFPNMATIYVAVQYKGCDRCFLIHQHGLFICTESKTPQQPVNAATEPQPSTSDNVLWLLCWLGLVACLCDPPPPLWLLSYWLAEKHYNKCLTCAPDAFSFSISSLLTLSCSCFVFLVLRHTNLYWFPYSWFLGSLFPVGCGRFFPVLWGAWLCVLLAHRFGVLLTKAA